VRSLSNSPAHRNGPPQEHRESVYRSVARGEVDQALRLILAADRRLATDEQVLDFLNFAMHRGIDLSEIRVAEESGRIVWAILPVLSPGRTMLLLSPPRVSPRLSDTIAPRLIGDVVDRFAARDVHLAQALIDPSDRAVVELYKSCAFERLAELIYLRRAAQRRERPELPTGTRWVHYAPAAHERFGRAIAATYAGSLDCPGLNGRRSMEDVIAGHKAAGEFEPRLWHLLCADHHDDPLGVLLLSRSARSDAMELVYLGVAPEHRGQRIGELMMAQALAVAAESGCSQLTLAVDSRNEPALKLYYRSGMSRVCTRVALLRDLRNAAQTPVST